MRRRLGAEQITLKPCRSLEMEPQQTFSQVLSCFFFSAKFVLDDRYTSARREATHGFREFDIFILHQKLKNRSSSAAPMAIVRLLRGTNKERGRLFLVKRANRTEFRSRAF